MPVAVSGVVCPAVTDAVAGVMAMAVKAAGVTVSVTLVAEIPFSDAPTVLVPCASVLATPLALTVATAVLLDVQVTEPDTLPVVPSV